MKLKGYGRQKKQQTDLPSQFGVTWDESSMVASHKRLTQEKLGKINWCKPYFNLGMLLLRLVRCEAFGLNSELLRKCVSDVGNNVRIVSAYPRCIIKLNAKANFYAIKSLVRTKMYRYI